MFRVVRKIPASRLVRRVFPRIVRRFARRKDGAAAIEFAMVAAPFLALTFAILETALIFFASQVLETATADSGRLVMTGQAQKQGFNESQFKAQVCARIYGLFDCATGIQVDVRTYASFSAVNGGKPIDGQGNFNLNPAFQPGGPGDIVVVRLFYQWPVYVSLLGLNLADIQGNKRLIMATAAFRNEPYQ